MPVITTEHIFKQFGGTLAVDDISFDLHPGEILGLLGPNGAGKTTTLRMVLDIFKPDRGSIAVFGGPMDEAKKQKIGYLPEERGLYQDITLEQCLVYLASLKGMTRAEITERLNDFLDVFDLVDYRTKKVKEMSKGMQQKAQLITTLIHNPGLLIVDEPFSALDPVNTQMAKDILRDARSEGTAIILCTHQMNQAEELCDRILLIDKGRIVLSGNMNELRKRFSRSEILIRTDDALPENIIGVKAIEPEHGALTRLYLQDAAQPSQVLKELVDSGTHIDAFEVEAPSLEEIFIETVSNPKKK